MIVSGWFCMMCGLPEADCNAGKQQDPKDVVPQFYPCAHERVWWQQWDTEERGGRIIDAILSGASE